ncbi:MAG: ABC transporter permease [Albidovulum sp.]|nr:ABC transporter permease [Albidovulum sp.]MDE0532732.1 ABC transporter permease [Albidovulum sp.]
MLPLELRFERRLETAPWLGPSLPILAIFVALFIGALILWTTGRDPATGYSDIFQAAFTKPGALTATALSATPLVFTGLTAALAFRIGIWNIGGDGQLMIGALAAATSGVALGHLGAWISIPAMIVAGAAGGALWGLIPAYFRARSGTSEVLTTLMLNYLAPLLLGYLIFSSKSWWRDLTSPGAKVFPQAKTIPFDTFWPVWGADIAIPFGFVLGIFMAVLMQIVLRTTKYGFEVLVTADSPLAGNYAGIRTKRVFITVFLLSAALAGIGGASQIGDFTYRLEPRTLQFAAYGYTGIAVAALARYNPIAVVVAAFFIGGLVNANLSLQGPELPLGLLGVIQGLILLFVAASEISARYRVVARYKSRPPIQ